MAGPRTDVTTGDRVLPAPGRDARLAEVGACCPFCPGNEALTPPELARHPDSPEWAVRAVPNRYPLVPPPDGRHEVVIESARHFWDFPVATDAELTAVLRMLRARHRALAGHAAIVTFRNRGPGSGASREHPHTQIVALNWTPARLRHMWDRAARAPYDGLRAAAAIDARRVAGHDRATAFVPPAPIADYETWIVPHNAGPSFAAARDVDLEACAALLRVVTGAYATVVPSAPYHLVLYTAPASRPAFRWHVRLLPRPTPQAGFEAATGVLVTTVEPREAAATLRGRV